MTEETAMNKIDIYVKNMALFINKKIKENGIGPAELANQTGLSIYEVRNMREGKLKKINMQNVFRIARYFGCEVETILGSKSLPEELRADYQLVEYEEPFYSYYGDRVFGIRDYFLKKYDEQYEQCVIGTIHSFVSAHKLATGYFAEDIDREKTRLLTTELIENEYQEYIIDQFIAEKKSSKAKETNIDEKKSTAVKIGENLRVIREFRKISKEKLSEKTNISTDVLYRIEKGMNKKINYEQLIKISTACLCTLDFLLGKSYDPVSDGNGEDVFYGLNKTFIQRHVELGHDMAYVALYMDEQSKTLVKGIIDNLNLMYKQKVMTDSLNRKSLSLAEVYVREQAAFREGHPKRGYSIRKREYDV